MPVRKGSRRWDARNADQVPGDVFGDADLEEGAGSLEQRAADRGGSVADRGGDHDGGRAAVFPEWLHPHRELVQSERATAHQRNIALATPKQNEV